MEASEQTRISADRCEHSDQDNPAGIRLFRPRTDSERATRSQTARTVETEPGPAIRVVETTLQLAHQLRGLLAEALSEFEMNEVRFQVLKFVFETGSTGCSQRDLAEVLSQSESSISTLVERMRGDRLLYRLREQHDRRKHVLLLSEQGHRVYDAVRLHRAHRIAELLAGLTPREVGVLSTLLRRASEELSPCSSAGLRRLRAG